MLADAGRPEPRVALSRAERVRPDPESCGREEARVPRLLVLTDDLSGGTGQHMLELLDRVARSGWSVEVASTVPNETRLPDLVQVSRLTMGRGLYPLPHLRLLRSIRRVIRRFRPDVVHSYFFWPILCSRILRMAGAAPALVENREDEGFNWAGHEYAWLRLTRPAPERVICVSRSVQEVVAKREGLDGSVTTVVPNGIDANLVGEGALSAARETALREELGLPRGDPVVGMVANLDREVKGGRWFVEAVPGVLERVPSARFLVVGLGGDAPEIRDRLGELGVADRVVLTGFRNDVGDCYRIMDVSVLTSLSEGLSITLLESMACGLPVVATRVGGNSDVVVDGETGFLVPPRDPEAWAGGVVRLLESPDLRARMGDAGRSRVREAFSLDLATERYLEVYREAAGRGRAGARRAPPAD